MRIIDRPIVGWLLTLAFGCANATVIYFSDDLGKVGKYDDVTHEVSRVGNAGAGNPVLEVNGIAWDASNERILLLDHRVPAVYAMNPTTGTAMLLFDPGFQFQGGAVGRSSGRTSPTRAETHAA
jgi:hypothetical protein